MFRSDDRYDYRAYLAARVRRYRLAQSTEDEGACVGNPKPAKIETGRFAPPDVHAVWALPCFDNTHVVQIVWHEDGDVFGCRIGPVGAV